MDNNEKESKDITIPPGFEIDFQRVQQLEQQEQQNPVATKLLIELYTRILERLDSSEFPTLYSHIQNNLGNAHSDLNTGDKTANLEQAITCYQEALRFWAPETTPLDYAMVQHNLGNVYQQWPTGDKTVNLARAIACYQEALRFRTPEAVPYEYAATQSDLSNAYRNLPTGDHAANLAKAITCCQEALRFFTPETIPLDYAVAQNNLGNIYRNLPTGDRAANLTQAITCYQEALRFWTPEIAPFAYAAAQNNLGLIYNDLPTGDHAANLTQAITCYQEVLRFWTPEIAPFDYAMVQNNLGNAYGDLPIGDRAVNLTQAITCYQESLRFRTPETTPFDYATVQNNLGTAYGDLPIGDRTDNLTQAVKSFHEALRFWTPETTPFDYAMVQNNLGNAYRQFPADDHAGSQSQAIMAFREALRFWTSDVAPLEYRTTNRNLANLYFVRKEWEAALEAYRAAMNAGERLYRAGLSSESKAAEIAENVALYHHAAFAAVRCGQTDEALFILERGKTRILAEALRLGISRPENIPDEVWTAFEQAGAAVRAVQSRNAATVSDEADPIQDYRIRERAAHNANIALDAAIESIRIYSQDFLQEISISTLQDLLPDKRTALIAFCITTQGSTGFVVSHHNNLEVQAVELPHFTQTDLGHLFSEWDTRRRSVGGWLGAYDQHVTEDTQETLDVWQETIERTLVELGQHLLAPILSTLPSSIEKIIFLPSAELFLLPLHATPLSNGHAERVCDRYQVSYAPSIEVLVNTRTKAMHTVHPSLYAVINPTDDPRLIFTSVEGQAIAKLFAQHQVDEGRAGTKDRVIAAVRKNTYVHFSCHGSYNWNNPLASGLSLADNDQLTLAELQYGIVDMSSTRIVTLSACETGISDVIRGSSQEYVGMPAGFLLAGVPCIVSTLWAVRDHLSTALLMERFYSNHLAGGMDFAAALCEAQIWIRGLKIGAVAAYAEQWYRQSTQREKKTLFNFMRYYRYLAEKDPNLCLFEHPYYWAAFTVNGI